MNKTVAKSQQSKNCMLPKAASHGKRTVPLATGITFKTPKVQIGDIVETPWITWVS